MLEMELYRGVKLIQLLPIALFVIFYMVVLLRGSRHKDRADGRVGISPDHGPGLRGAWKELLDRDVKVRHLLAIAGVCVLVVLLAAAGRYYIQRTGHTSSAAVPVFELELRNRLERLLTARPRIKEFLIGWPCLMLFIWSVFRRLRILPLLFGIGGTIGLTSVTNTFLHIRTPLAFNLLRTCYGLLFGLAAGIVALLIAELIYRTAYKGRAG